MIEVIDEQLNTQETDNKIKYLITYDNGETAVATIDLLTPVDVQGTPHNRSLFTAIQEFLMTSTDPQSFEVTAKAKNTGNEIQTTTLTTAGRRYYLLTFSTTSPDCTFGLYDAQANRFIIGGYYGRYVDSVENTFATNVESLQLAKEGNATVNLSCSLTDTTLTLNVSKTTTTNNGTPAITITVNELGGFLL